MPTSFAGAKGRKCFLRKLKKIPMIIDSHQHVFWHGRDDAGLIADMDAHGIELAWLLTWEIPASVEYDSRPFLRVLNPERLRSDGSHPGIPLADLLRAKRHYPERFVLGYCPNPAAPGAPELFEAACEMHGVQVCGEWKFRMPIDSPPSLELFRTAGRRKAPVVLHLDVPYLPPRGGAYCHQWYGGTVENLERALTACPETLFIGHAPGFWREISADADLAEAPYPGGPVTRGGRLECLFDRYPNLYADLSAGSALRALQRDSGYAKEFLERFKDRLLFGRDIYGGELQAFLGTLALSQETRDAIFHANATRLLAGSVRKPRQEQHRGTTPAP